MAALLFLGTAFGSQPGPDASAAPPSIEQQQRAIHERVQRLEGAMLRLSSSLASGEPDKAERLREALEKVGALRLKTRVEELAALVRDGRFSEAEREQTAVLADFDALLKLLTSPLNVADARREERKKLEALKRSIRELMDEQIQHVYKTQHLEQKAAPAEGQAASPDAAEAARQLEQLQRDTQQKAARLAGQMKGGDEKSPDKPGTESMEKAADSMRQAGEKLADGQPGKARPPQEKSLENMQEALDELDDALRQVRKEEVEETLAALSTRLASLLEKEKQVGAAVVELAPKSVDQWNRTDHMRAGEAAETQSQTAADCEVAVRLVTDEGTTVLIPELLGQIAADMSLIERRLRKSDASNSTRIAVDEVIASLEEILALVEKKREENRKAEEQEPGQPQAQQAEPEDPLLSKSAEIRLLRSVQMRLNERTAAAAVAQDEAARAEYPSLAARQSRLADLTRRMNDGGAK